MKASNLIVVFAIVLFLLSACATHQDKRQVIADKIQYDVFIKGPHPEYDWWIDNLPGPQREDLVNWIFDMAESGKIQAYDYFDKKLSREDIEKIGVDTIYQTLKRTTPPFQPYDTMIVTKLERKDITKVRFIERWYFNEAKNGIEKEVIGIAPVKEMLDANGKFKGNYPLFFLYFNRPGNSVK